MNFQEQIDKAIKDRWIYFVGERLPTDWYAAFKEWKKLAEDGDLKAQVNVGKCYANGLGIEVNKQQAFIWLSKAKDQNDPRAYRDLFYLFSSDGSDEKDLRMAEEFLSKAVALEEPNALLVIQGRKAAKTKQEKERSAAIYASEMQQEKVVNDARAKALAARSDALAKEVQEAFSLHDLAKARKLLTAPENKDILWTSRLLPYLSITTTHTKEHKMESSYIDRGTLRGTSEFVETRHKSWRGIVRFHNPTSEILKIEPSLILPANGRKTEETSYNGSETDREQAFSPDYHYVHNHTFRIPHSPPLILPARKSRKNGCFVLTACFGNQEHPVVVDFRRFRDDYLLKHAPGRLMINFYYRIGPTLASIVVRHPRVMAALRVVFGAVKSILPRRSKGE